VVIPDPGGISGGCAICRCPARRAVGDLIAICSVCKFLRVARDELHTSLAMQQGMAPANEDDLQRSIVRVFNALICVGDRGAKAREYIVGVFLAADGSRQVGSAVLHCRLVAARAAISAAMQRREMEHGQKALPRGRLPAATETP
jgi:hypothetical protein